MITEQEMHYSGARRSTNITRLRRRMGARGPLLMLFAIGGLIGILLLLADQRSIAQSLQSASLRGLPWLLLSVLTSYAAASLSFALLGRMLGIRMTLWDFSLIGFIGIALNHVFTSGGLAGNSVRLLAMRRHGVDYGDGLITIVLHFYFTSLVMLAMLPLALIHILRTASMSSTGTIALAVAIVLIGAFWVWASALISLHDTRTTILTRLAAWFRSLSGIDYGPAAERFSRNLLGSVRAIRSRPAEMGFVLFLLIVDWLAGAAVLWLCLDAFGVQVGTATLISAYVLGIVAGVVSMVPGGIGVQEASMAGILAWLGVSFEAAAMAAIMFRLVFYLVPYGVSLLVYLTFLRGTEEERSGGVEHANLDAEPWIPTHH